MNLLRVEPLPGCESEIGRWLWGLNEVRQRTLGLVETVDQRTLDWEGPDGQENAIGSLLYHIALVEASWLFLDILQRHMPDSVSAHFPHDKAQRGLVRVTGVPVVEHLGRMRLIREIFLNEILSMTLAEWRRLRSPVDRQDYEVTPEWATFHLIEHEAGHAFQISSLCARAARHVAPVN